MNLFLLCGVGCSGKTALAKSLAKIAPEIEIVPSGEWKRQIVNENSGLSKDFRSWHDLDQTQTDFLNTVFFNRLSEEYDATDKAVLVETHLVYRHDFFFDGWHHEFVNVVSDGVLADTSGVILMDAPLKEIVERNEKEMIQVQRLSSLDLENISEERALEDMRVLFADQIFGIPCMRLHSYPSKISPGQTIPSIESLAKIAKSFIMAKWDLSGKS